jgi:hypothetical protein
MKRWDTVRSFIAPPRGQIERMSVNGGEEGERCVSVVVEEEGGKGW